MAYRVNAANNLFQNVAFGTTLFCVSFWAKPTSDATANEIRFTNGIGGYHMISLVGTVAGDPAQAGTHNGVGISVAQTTNSYTANQWNHVYAAFNGTSYRAINLNNGGLFTNASARTIYSPTVIRFVNAGELIIEHFAVWLSIHLTAQEQTLLANGANPLRIRPASLYMYMPFDDGNDIDKDIYAKTTGVVTGSPVKENQSSRVLHPSSRLHVAQPIIVTPPVVTVAKRTPTIYNNNFAIV